MWLGIDPDIAPPIDSDARLAACATCPDLQPESRRCRLCGCASTVDDAARSPWRSCPAGLWPTTSIPT